VPTPYHRQRLDRCTHVWATGTTMGPEVAPEQLLVVVSGQIDGTHAWATGTTMGSEVVPEQLPLEAMTHEVLVDQVSLGRCT
jgi:hypothetical protein